MSQSCRPYSTYGFSSCNLSIVAIHGLGAHPEDTWTAKRSDAVGDRWVSWLSEPDMLPSVAPAARIVRYGYRSAWFGDESVKQRASIVARNFLMCLEDDLNASATISYVLLRINGEFLGITGSASAGCCP